MKWLCRRFTDPNAHEQWLQIVCPGPKHQEVWKRHHEATAYAAAKGTLTTSRRHFFWIKMEIEMWGFKSGCVNCSLQKDRAEPRAPLNSVTVTSSLEVIALDFLLLSRPGDTYHKTSGYD